MQEQIPFKMGNRWEDPDFSTLISCVSLLTRSCELPRDSPNPPSTPIDEEGIANEEEDLGDAEKQEGSQPQLDRQVIVETPKFYPPTQEEGTSSSLNS